MVHELTIVILFFIPVTLQGVSPKQVVSAAATGAQTVGWKPTASRESEQELRFIKKQIRPHFLFNTW